MSMQELFPWRTQGRHAAPKSSDDLLMPLHQGIDRLFSDFFGADFPRLTHFQWDGGFSPSMDVTETDGQLEVTAELPGAAPPMSGQCTRLAAKPSTPASSKIGEMMVMSGRCEPPE